MALLKRNKQKREGGWRRLLRRGDKSGGETQPQGALPSADEDGTLTRFLHGLKMKFSASPPSSEATCHHNDLDRGDTARNQEQAVGDGSVHGAAEVDKEEAEKRVGEIQTSALAQGDFRASEVKVRTKKKVGAEKPKTMLAKQTVNAKKTHAKELREEAKEIKDVELPTLVEDHRRLAMVVEKLPWLARLVTYMLVMTVLAWVVMTGFDYAVITMAGSFLPVEAWMRPFFAIFTGLGIMLVVTLLAWGWAAAIGSPEHTKLFRRPPLLGFLAMAMATAVAYGGLFVAFDWMAAYRLEAVARKSHDLALDPAFVWPIQVALTTAVLCFETLHLILLKSKVVDRLLARAEGAIVGTRARIEGLIKNARKLELQAAEKEDDAEGLALLRIEGIEAVGEVEEEAERAMGLSAALAVPAHFWTYFFGTKAGIFSFRSTEEETLDLQQAVENGRRRLMMTVAGACAVVGAGLATALLLGPLAGLAAALAVAAFIAFRAGVAPKVKGSLRRMAISDIGRAVAVIGLLSFATGAAAWSLLGPLAAFAALLAMAGVLTFRAFGGSQEAGGPDAELNALESMISPEEITVRSNGGGVRADPATTFAPVSDPSLPGASTNGAGAASAEDR